MSDNKRNLCVTTALYYANGDLHLGHVIELIQADIWVRFQKLRGHHCRLVGGSDAHGTPVMLKAEAMGLTPEALIEQIHASHKQDCADFLVDFDSFYSTHSPENQALSTRCYDNLLQHGDIIERTIEQFYDSEKGIFLPDRYVKGACPKCQAPDQYGDNCERCGATYDPTELRHPYSVLSQTPPTRRQTTHAFFNLPNYESFLKTWLEESDLQPEVKNKLQEWFESGLQAWDITRDGPYFGFPIPGRDNQYFYVWLDAPIGYMASTQHQLPEEFSDIWEKADSPYERYHFIGKDIIYFHALFWPAILKGSGFNLPTGIFAHGFLTVNGEKMSKSRGTLIRAKHYLKHCPAEPLRFYFASKLNAGVDDCDFNTEDFVHRYNGDIVGKWVNIAARCAKFLDSHFDSKLGVIDDANLQSAHAAATSIADHYEHRRFNQAIRQIMTLADQINQRIDLEKPWIMIKNPEQHAAVHQLISEAIEVVRILSIYLQPVLPKLSATIMTDWLQLSPQQWSDITKPLVKGHQTRPFKPLAQRLTTEQVEAIMSNPDENQTPKAPEKPQPAAVEKDNTIGIDDFMAVDLRIAKIIEANHVEGADKLLQLKLDVGELGTKQVFAGIKSAYAPEDLIDRYTVMVANLAPRKMRFGLSEGMVLAAGPGGSELWILSPDSGAQAGMRVK